MNQVGGSCLCSSATYSAWPAVGRRIRPVVYLKSDVTLTGSSETGWTID